MWSLDYCSTLQGTMKLPWLSDSSSLKLLTDTVSNGVVSASVKVILEITLICSYAK